MKKLKKLIVIINATKNHKFLSFSVKKNIVPVVIIATNDITFGNRSDI